MRLYVRRTTNVTIPLTPGSQAANFIPPFTAASVIGNTKVTVDSTNRAVSAYTASSAASTSVAVAGEIQGVTLWRRVATLPTSAPPILVPLSPVMSTVAWGADIGGSGPAPTAFQSIAEAFPFVSGHYDSKPVLTYPRDTVGDAFTPQFRAGLGQSILASTYVIPATGSAFSLAGAARFDYANQLPSVAGVGSVDAGVGLSGMWSLDPYADTGNFFALDPSGLWAQIGCVTSIFIIDIEDIAMVATGDVTKDTWIRVSSSSTSNATPVIPTTFQGAGIRSIVDLVAGSLHSSLSSFVHLPSLNAVSSITTSGSTVQSSIINSPAGTYSANVTQEVTVSTAPINHYQLVYANDPSTALPGPI